MTDFKVIEDLPIEVWLDICQRIDLESISQLARVSHFFYSLIKANRPAILFPILRREYSPFHELLQVYTASEDDIRAKGHTFQPRRIIFRRFPGDGGLVLCSGGFNSAAQPSSTFKATIGVFSGAKRFPSNSPPLQTVVLREENLDSLLRYCMVVRRWEGIFPQLRWVKHPEDCRHLRGHELERLRRALYRWWLYAYYFHGDFQRPRSGQPTAFVDDIRVSQMRMYPTSELLELLDLLTAAFHLVQHYICPTLEQNLELGLRNSLASETDVLWNDQSRLGRIIRTYAKLDPQEMLHYFKYVYSYGKRRLISDIRVRHATFTDDQESLQAAIRSTLTERHWLVTYPSLATDREGGIVDFGDGRDEERQHFASDGSSDGSLPKPAKYILRPYSDYAPRGDDGAGSDDWSYPPPRVHDRLVLSPVVH